MTAHLDGLKVAVLIERGVNEIEFEYSRLRLREAGAQVVVVGSERLEYTGEDHVQLRADATITEVASADFDGVVIPGGLSPEKLRQNARVVLFVRDLYDRGKVCAAICHGQQVMISARLLRNRKAVAAWSMVDDLIYTGAQHVADARAIRDGMLVTARFAHDLPQFAYLMLEAFAENERRTLPPGYGGRLRGQRFGIVADDASNFIQTLYPKYRLEEEGGTALLLGRKAGAAIRLSSPTWEWGERGIATTIDQSLEDTGVATSDDFPYDESLRAARASQLDGLIVPGGLGAWMIRGHPGLQKLIQEMNAAGKPIAAIERGPKVLLSAGVLAGRTATCSGEMRDDLIAADVDYRDDRVVRDGNLLTCQGTDDLPAWAAAWMTMCDEVKSAEGERGVLVAPKQ